MQKILILFLVVSISLTACRPRKIVMPIKSAIDKKDTVQNIIIKESPIVDSVAIVKEIMGKVSHHKIDFYTFNAKIKAEYEGPEESQNFTAYLSIIKDSVIYIQLKGFLGIIGLQTKITKDSITIVNKVGDKYVQKRAISYLNDITQIPFDFFTLQNLLVGNPIFIDSNIVSYRNSNDNKLIVLMIGSVFKNLITIDNNNLLVLHSKLDDVDIIKNRTCDITLSNFVTVDDHQFSTFRNISVSEKAKLKVNLDFKEFSFNQPINYSFSLPKNYKLK